MGVGRPVNHERRKERQDGFLAAFARTGVLKLASKESGVPVPTHHLWTKQDSEYAERFHVLKEQTQDLAKQHRSPSGRKKGSKLGGRIGADKVRRQEAFLAAFAESGVVADAARVAEIALTAHYQWVSSDPEYAERAKKIQIATRDLRKEVLAERVSKASKASWANSDRRAEWAKNQKESWTPEMRQAQGERVKKRMADPKYRQSWIDAQAAARSTPEAREANRERMKKVWADPEKRAKFLTAAQDPERRKRVSEATKKQWASVSPEERRERMKGMRKVFKGGHRLTKIEADTALALNKRRIPYFLHDEIDGYIADFMVPSLNLIIECDGSYHHDRRLDTDAVRDETLAALGYTTLRLSEGEIKNGDWSRLDEMISHLI